MSPDAYFQQVFKQAGLGAYADSPEDDTQTNTSQTNSSISFPVDEDAIFMLSRAFPVDGSIHLNSGRPLEHCLVLRCVAQNCGVKDDDDSSETSTASDLVLTSKAVVIQEAITFPSPETLFAIIWKLIPVYIQQKITDLADENNARAITQEIYSYVKVALGLLPIPVPGIFIDAAVNLVVPPLVAYIVTKLSSSTQDTSAVAAAKVGGEAFGVGYVATAKTRQIMKKFHRKLLLRAGVPISQLPAHLQLTANAGSLRQNDAGGNDGTDGSEYPSFGWPNQRDSKGDLENFYDGCFLNGCLRMILAQVITAQIRSNPSSDQEPITFSTAVWKTLTAAQKKDFKDWATEDPPNENKLSNGLYQPVYDILAKSPYDVPDPIRPAFAAMKVPKVTAWVIDTYGADS